jgi:hypothetical protein
MEAVVRRANVLLLFGTKVGYASPRADLIIATKQGYEGLTALRRRTY